MALDIHLISVQREEFASACILHKTKGGQRLAKQFASIPAFCPRCNPSAQGRESWRWGKNASHFYSFAFIEVSKKADITH